MLSLCHARSTHTLTHVCTNMHVCECTHTCRHTHERMQADTRALMEMYARVNALTESGIGEHTNTCVLAHAGLRENACTHTVALCRPQGQRHPRRGSSEAREKLPVPAPSPSSAPGSPSWLSAALLSSGHRQNADRRGQAASSACTPLGGWAGR